MSPPTFPELQSLLLSHLDHTGCDLSDLTHGALFTDLGADPTDILDIALDLESSFQLEFGIPEDVIETFTTPGAIFRWLEDTLDPQP
jgi:acyl carrier protein